MLAALLAAQFASLVNARAYLEAQLTMKNRDNATALAMALSQEHTQSEDIALAANALFNSGYYDLIIIADPDGKPLVEKIATSGDAAAPAWFVRLLPMRPAPGQAEITSGWRQLGRVTLASRASFAYRALWDSAVTLAGVMLAATLLGGLLGSLVLSRLRGPMRAVIDQARAITERRYITIPEPKVPELRQLAAAMNDTVQRLRSQFEEDAKRYELMRLQANYDALTGLPNRSLFLANLGENLDDPHTGGGALAVIRVSDLRALNRAIGRQAADDLLVRLAASVALWGDRCPGAFTGRLNSADFALLFSPECEARPALTQLMSELESTVKPVQGAALHLFVGFGVFAPGEDAGALLSRIDMAVAVAEARGASALEEASPIFGAPAPRNAEQWRAVIDLACQSPESLELVEHPLQLHDDRSHQVCELSLRTSGGDERLPARRFMPVAQRLGLAPPLDLMALERVLQRLEDAPELAGLWLQLDTSSIDDHAFRLRLPDLLSTYQGAGSRLWLSFQENGALRHLPGFRTLAAEFKQAGCRVGLHHYGHQFDRVTQLYGLGLDYLMVDGSFVRGIDGNPGNQSFLAGVCDIAHQIGALVLAESVDSPEDARQLQQIGFDGMVFSYAAVG
jgi:EAL domain-containing protein (putative c-di-GMP-specific phosphodiesterase class I)